MSAAGQDRSGEVLESVASALERGPLPLSQAVKIVDRVCEILSGIHGAGQIHGAIHPGVVRFHHLGGHLTVVLDPGSAPPPSHTSPEVARGGVATMRSDVYAVGLLLHEAITGRAVFAAPTPEDALRRQIEMEAPSLLDVQLQDVPLELDALVTQMLSKAPGRRPKTIDAVRAALQNLELDSTIMGVRLSEMKNVALELGAVPVARNEPEAPTRVAEAPTIAEDHADRPAISTFGATPGADVDPFADTFIRNRSDLGLDSEDTQMTLPPARALGLEPAVRATPAVESSVLRPEADPAEFSPRVPVTSPMSVPQDDAKPLSTWIALLIGVAVFAVTLVTILLVAG